VRRKNHGGIKLVVDATLEGSERLLAGLKEINETAKVLKRQEMEMGLRIYQDEMNYKHDKDEKVLENARLFVLNQSAVVAAMASLADATRGGKQSTSRDTPNNNNGGQDVPQQVAVGTTHDAAPPTSNKDDSDGILQ
jgi:hypothetical protein